MPTLSKTYGATIVTSNQTVQYAGPDVNSFFGGNRIAMLAFGAPSALGAEEQVSNAVLSCWVKADTAADYDNITIGLIDASWSGGNSGFPGMYAACSGPTVTAPLSAGMTESQASLPIGGLLQAWASNPTTYSGLYLACPTLNLTRVGATNCNIEYETVTLGAAKAPTSVSLSALICEIAPTFSFSGAAGGTNNALTGYQIQVADSTDGINFSGWVLYQNLTTTDTSGSLIIALPAQRGYYRKVRICALGEAGMPSGWVETPAFRYNSAPTIPAVNFPSTNDYHTYNKAIRFLVTIPWDADDQLMTLEVPEGSPAIKTSSPAPFRRGKQLIVQRADGGSYTTPGMVPTELSIFARDEMGVAGSTVQRKAFAANPENMTVDPSFEPGGTPIRAAHINDLRLAIQLLRNVYGITITNWEGGDVIAGTTPTSGWADHVAEMRTAIDAIIGKINTWDDTAVDCLMEAPEWIPITGTRPRADVMEQLRTVIASI